MLNWVNSYGNFTGLGRFLQVVEWRQEGSATHVMTSHFKLYKVTINVKKTNLSNLAFMIARKAFGTVRFRVGFSSHLRS